MANDVLPEPVAPAMTISWVGFKPPAIASSIGSMPVGVPGSM